MKIDQIALEEYIREHRREVENNPFSAQPSIPIQTIREPAIPRGYMGFVTTTALFAADSFSKVKHYEDFNTVFENIRQRYNLGPVNARIAQKVNMTEDYFNRLFSRNGISERGTLWALSIGLKLNFADAEKLFKSCGQTIEGSYFIKKSGKEEEYYLQVDREGFLLYFLNHPNEYDDIDDINEELTRRGMKTLGNCD